LYDDDNDYDYEASRELNGIDKDKYVMYVFEHDEDDDEDGDDRNGKRNMDDTSSDGSDDPMEMFSESDEEDTPPNLLYGVILKDINGKETVVENKDVNILVDHILKCNNLINLSIKCMSTGTVRLSHILKSMQKFDNLVSLKFKLRRYGGSVIPAISQLVNKQLKCEVLHFSWVDIYPKDFPLLQNNKLINSSVKTLKVKEICDCGEQMIENHFHPVLDWASGLPNIEFLNVQYMSLMHIYGKAGDENACYQFIKYLKSLKHLNNLKMQSCVFYVFDYGRPDDFDLIPFNKDYNTNVNKVIREKGLNEEEVRKRNAMFIAFFKNISMLNLHTFTMIDNAKLSLYEFGIMLSMFKGNLKLDTLNLISCCIDDRLLYGLLQVLNTYQPQVQHLSLYSNNIVLNSAQLVSNITRNHKFITLDLGRNKIYSYNFDAFLKLCEQCDSLSLRTIHFVDNRCSIHPKNIEDTVSRLKERGIPFTVDTQGDWKTVPIEISAIVTVSNRSSTTTNTI